MPMKHHMHHNRQHRYEQRHRQVERDDAAPRRGTVEQLRRRLLRPWIDVLDGDHHDRCRQHRPRHVGHQRKQHCRCGKQHQRVDDDRDPGTAAERAVADAWADVDAVGDAAECASHGTGRAKSHQQPVTIVADLARLAREPGAEQRVDRSDDASASAPATIAGIERISGSAIVSGEKSTSTLRIAALAVSGPMTGPSPEPKLASSRP